MSEYTAISVIGAGIMGHGLATHFVLKNCSVTLIDHRQSNLDTAKKQIREAVTFLRNKSLTDVTPDGAISDITFTLDEKAGVANADLLIENISEDKDAKQEIFASVGEAAPNKAVLATNTSSIPISEIADEVPEYADRIVGCHWLNPPYLLPIVEVVRGAETSDKTVDRACEFVEMVDREPILVKKDIPGFVWNRIQFAVLRECMHLLENDIASLEDVNQAVRDGYALRTTVVGPFETVDLSGLSLFQSISADIYPSLCDDSVPSDLFDEYIDAGRKGAANGAGFYDYNEKFTELIQDRNERIAEVRGVLSNKE